MRSRYFPIERGLYEVVPGLKPLGFDFGNQSLDQKLFQIEDDFKRFRENKIQCRQERLSKYFVTKDLPPDAESATVHLITDRLVQEWPEIFQKIQFESGFRISARHTEETLTFDSQAKLLSYQGPLIPAPTQALDALAMLVPEDLSLLVRRNSSDWLAALHLCAPSHWSAEEKAGMSFSKVHLPIPGIERILKTADNIVDAMIHRGPFVRFVWSFVTDDRLNHHIEAPPDWDPVQWKGRSFDASQKNPFYFRVERQSMIGLPLAEASLFTIKISFWTATEIKADPVKRASLLSALRSMSPAARQYKGVAHCFEDVTRWLESEA